MLEQGGVSTASQRGYHLLVSLSLRAVVCQGPVVTRESGPSREQYVVLTDEWVTDPASPSDPAAELFARFITSHGPAGVRDFAWWSGLPLGISRAAAEAASDRLSVVSDDGEPVYVAAGPPPRISGAAHEVMALPPYEEYYLSYTDRTVPCAPEFLTRIGPSMNGIVRPIIAGARRDRRCLDPLGGGRPTCGRAGARTVRSGRGDGCRGRRGAGPLPCLHHRLSAPVPHCDP